MDQQLKEMISGGDKEGVRISFRDTPDEIEVKTAGKDEGIPRLYR